MPENKKRESFLFELLERGKFIYYAAMIGAVGSVLSLVITVFFEKDPVVRLKKSELQELRSSVEGLQRQVGNLEADMKSHRDGLQALVKDADDVEVATLGKQIEGLSEEFDTLRTSLGGDVERSLSVALLRKDLEAAESEIENALDVANRSTDRVYDQNKWFLGLMATMTLSVIGLSISVFKARKEAEKEG